MRAASRRPFGSVFDLHRLKKGAPNRAALLPFLAKPTAERTIAVSDVFPIPTRATGLANIADDSIPARIVGPARMVGINLGHRAVPMGSIRA
jgi:hypothetical protein